MRHGVEVAEPLREAQPGRKQRIVGAQDLNHPASPANSLPHVGRQPLSGQTSRLRDVDVRRVPAVRLHAQGGVRVFCDGLHGDATDFIERLAPQHRAGTAEKRRVPEVVAILHNAVKQLVFVRDDVKLAQVALERIGRIEVVRRLQHGQVVVTHKPADGHLQKAARGHVVAVEDRNVRRRQRLQRGVDVAGLGMKIVGANLVAHARFESEISELLASPVIQDVHVQFFGRPVDVQSAQCGIANNLERLVIGGNQNVDMRPLDRALPAAASAHAARARSSENTLETK